MAVVGLGAYCELETDAERRFHCRVSEFAVLDDGREIVLHAERGFASGTNAPEGIWPHMTVEALEQDVLNTVLPDDAEETGEEHPWEWLRELLAAHGVQASVEELRAVPYEVRLGPAVLARLQTA